MLRFIPTYFLERSAHTLILMTGFLIVSYGAPNRAALWLNVTDHTSEIKWAIIANRYIIAVLDVDR